MTTKKALCLASMASNLDNFNRGNVAELQKLGYEVTLASNFNTPEDINSKEKTEAFMKEMASIGVRTVQVDFSRSVRRFGMHRRAYKQVKELLKEGCDLIHCHTPVGAAIARLAARKLQKRGQLKVIYTAHGFHFFKGAPLLYWLLFYPIEKYLSKYTDVQITINKEDFERASKKFRAKKTVYVPGIGVDVEGLRRAAGKESKRSELGIPSDAKLLISVGELSKRKNHLPVIEALNDLDNPDVYYVIVGMGALAEQLKAADKTGRLILMGYRKDVPELIGAADLFVFPSLQEGLPVALMEAMAIGTPCICSRIRGNTDLMTDERLLFNPHSKDSIRKAIGHALSASEQEIRESVLKNETVVRECDKKIVAEKMREVYQNI